MVATRRQLIRIGLGTTAAALLAACQGTGQSGPTPRPVGNTPDNPLIRPTVQGTGMVALQASSELALGRNRFALGLVDERNRPLTAGTVLVEFFKVQSDGTGEKKAESPAIFRSVGGNSRGVWVAPADFKETGNWGAQVSLTGDVPRQARMNFQVQEKFSAPGYGELAIRTASLTTRDVGGDASHICTNQPPCELHALSIADALDAKKPLMVTFATPALCTSATCGPELDAVLQLNKTYGDRANFIHVEIFEYPFDGQHVAKAVDDWKLPSDPWTFVVDRAGIVRDRFEGAAPAEELEPALQAVLT